MIVNLDYFLSSHSEQNSGADPGFDQGGPPDRDRPKTAILGPQFCRILVLGPHFWWSGGGPGPRPPPWIRPWNYILNRVIDNSIVRLTLKTCQF